MVREAPAISMRRSCDGNLIALIEDDPYAILAVTERDGRLWSCAVVRRHFRGKGGDSHASERRGASCFVGRVASMGRHPRGFSLPQQFRR
jgi:hypothetical protein